MRKQLAIIIAVAAIAFATGWQAQMSWDQIEAALALDPNATSMPFQGTNHATKGQQWMYYTTSGIQVSDPGNEHGGSNLLTGQSGSSAAGAVVTLNGSYSVTPVCLNATVTSYQNKIATIRATGGGWICVRDTQ